MGLGRRLVGWGTDGDQAWRADDHGRNLTVNGGNEAGRGNINQTGRNNPGHERGRSYSGYVRGWQRRPYRGYRYSGSRFNVPAERGTAGCGVGGQGTRFHTANEIGALASAAQAGSQATTAQGAGANMQEHQGQGASEPQALEVFRSQKAGKAEMSEPKVPEVFKNEKPGKMKVDEGQLGEGDDKPFCFRCYKLGHGKLVCIAKLWCDICGSNEHMTGRCPILKQPRLPAHPCRYDVSGLGFYHIPHAPITFEKNDNRTALVMVEGGVLSIPQLVAELGRLIPERWLWNVIQ
jgi:hypothetical protein